MPSSGEARPWATRTICMYCRWEAVGGGAASFFLAAAGAAPHSGGECGGDGGGGGVQEACACSDCSEEDGGGGSGGPSGPEARCWAAATALNRASTETPGWCAPGGGATRPAVEAAMATTAH